MIKFVSKPFEEKDVYKILDKDVASWFKSKYKHFSPPQLFSVKMIHEKQNVLISSPTGTGKTLSAFLSVIDRLVRYAKEGTLENKVYTIYISPLKALGNDIKRNLDQPFAEISELIKSKGHEMQDIRHGVRSGDTSAYEKQKMNKYAPHILITTPESLALMLAAPKFKEKIKDVENIIVDEIHALAENKRGTHLALSMERLEHFCGKPLNRIGLSATISPIEDIANYLVGNERDCKVVDVSYLKKKDLKVVAPEKDPINSSPDSSHKALYKEIVSVILKNRTTLIFTNTRSGTESVVINLKKELSDKWEDAEDVIVAHHGSLSKEQRLDVESRMKNGEARVVVSSTSLELGIDIGTIDTVIQVGSPKSIARCLQRVGRAGHNLKSITMGHFICPDSDDLVEVAVMLKKSYENKVDSITMPRNCRDVLAQHIVGMSLDKKWYVSDAYFIVRKAYPYRDLTREEFEAILMFLAGNEELDASKMYGKIWYDKEEQMFGKRGRLAKLIYMSNIGTIPDSTRISVAVGKNVIGYIDEGFLEKLKKNDVFVLGGKTYVFKGSSGLRARVAPAAGKQPTVPSWFSEQLPLSFDLARDIQNFRAEVINSFAKGKSDKEILELISTTPVDIKAKKVLFKYFKTQFEYMKSFLGQFEYHPNTWLIEYLTLKDGFRIVFHTLYGRRVNDALSRMIAFLIGKRIKKNVALSVLDNGFVLHMPKEVYFDGSIIKGLDYEKILKESLEKTEILRRRFRHIAARGLMVLRRYKGYQMTVGRQQMTSQTLFKIVSKEKNFPLIDEAYREVMEDHLDVRNLKAVLQDMEKGRIDMLRMESNTPSPFAHKMLMAGMGDVVLIADRKAILKELYEQVQEKIEGK